MLKNLSRVKHHSRKFLSLILICVVCLSSSFQMTSIQFGKFEKDDQFTSKPIIETQNSPVRTATNTLDFTPPAARRIWTEPHGGLITSMDHVVVHIDGVSDYGSGIAEVICQVSLEGSVWHSYQAERLSDSKSSFISILPPQVPNTKVYYRVLLFDNAGNTAQLPSTSYFEYTVTSSSSVPDPVIEDILLSPTSEVVSGEHLAITALVSSVCNPETAHLEIRYSDNPSDSSSWLYQPLYPVGQSIVWDNLNSGVIYAGSINITSAPGTKLSFAAGFRDMWGRWVENTNDGSFYNITVVASQPIDTTAPSIHHKVVSSYNPSTQDYLWISLGISDDTTPRVGYQVVPTSGIEVSINNSGYTSLYHPGFPLLDGFPAIIPGYFYGLDTGPERLVVVRCRAFSVGDNISIRQTFVDPSGKSVSDVTNFTIAAPSVEDNSPPIDFAFQINQAREEVPTDLVLGVYDALSGLDIYGGCWLKYSVDGDSDFTNGPNDGEIPFNPLYPARLPATASGISRIYYQVTALDRAGEIFSTGIRYEDVVSHVDVMQPTIENAYLVEGTAISQGWSFELVLVAWDDSGIEKVIVNATSDNITFKTISINSTPHQLTENRYLIQCRSPGDIGASTIYLNVTVFDYFNKNSSIGISSLSLISNSNPNLSVPDSEITPLFPHAYEDLEFKGNLTSLLGIKTLGYSIGKLWYDIDGDGIFRYPLFTCDSQLENGIVSLNGVIPGLPVNSIISTGIDIRSITGELESISLGSYTILEDSPPVINVLNPQQGDVFNDSMSIAIQVEAHDPDGGISTVRYQIDSYGWVDITSNQTAGIYIGEWNAQNDPSIHTLRVSVRDVSDLETEALVIFQVEESLSSILLVDDDEGTFEEKPYIQGLNLLGVEYDIWLVNTSGLPSKNSLIPYSTVIWILGDNSQIGQSSDSLRTLEYFLRAGRSLLITGPKVTLQLGWTPFMFHYLKCLPSEIITNAETIEGDLGTDFVNENLSIDTQIPFTSLESVGTAYPVLHTSNSLKINKTVGVAYNASYSVLIYSFSLSMLNNSLSRASLINTSLSWLGECDIPHIKIVQNNQLLSVPPETPSTFIVSINPHINITNVHIKLNEENWENITSSYNGTHYNISKSLSKGWHELKARALFNDRIWIYSVVIKIYSGVLQESPPQIFLVEPEYLSNIPHRTILKVKVVDNGTITNVSISINDEQLIPLLQENQTIWFCDLITFTPGVYSVTVYAEDDQGYLSIFTTTFRKVQDQTPPFLERITPVKSYIITNNKEFFMRWNTEDLETGIKQTTIKINDSDSYQVSGTDITLSLPEGSNNITLISENSANMKSIFSVIVYIDVKAPQLIVNSPINGTETTKSEMLINWTVSDPGGGVVLLSIETEEESIDPGYDTTYLVSLNTGWNNITVIAEDLAGNINRTLILIFRRNKQDLSLLIIAGLGIVSVSGIALVIGIKKNPQWFNDKILRFIKKEKSD